MNKTSTDINENIIFILIRAYIHIKYEKIQINRAITLLNDVFYNIYNHDRMNTFIAWNA